jgi:hypothetical protein
MDTAVLAILEVSEKLFNKSEEEESTGSSTSTSTTSGQE